MPKTIPLGATLRIEIKFIVKTTVRADGTVIYQRVFEAATVKVGSSWFAKRPATESTD